MKMLEKLFGKNNKMVKEAKLPTPIVPEEETFAPVEYDYGLDKVERVLKSGDYGWKQPDENHKKVILTNPLECEKKITVMDMVSTWRGTGHFEWELLLGAWFVHSVVEAIDQNDNEAEITHMFNRDFLASGDRIFTQAQVYEHLIKWFDVVEETDETLKLKIQI